MFVKPVVSIKFFVTIAIKSFQPIQPVIEPVQIENPQFLEFQSIPIFGHSTKTLR